jgi:hypothetical protein
MVLAGIGRNYNANLLVYNKQTPFLLRDGL